ncbi:MAG: phosphoribosylglycinamide formyltransferase [Nitrospinales bacterium]
MTDNKFKLGVLVSGRGSNLQAIIDAIERGEVTAEIAIVISDKKNAPALERCRKHGISGVFLDPKSYPDKQGFEQALIGLLRERSVDLVCLAGFMRILGEEFIRSFQGRILNIHPSLLPAFPGLDAQKQALRHGVKVAGCTVHFVNGEVDAGPIVSQAAVPVRDDDNVESLSRRILKEEHRIYPAAIQAFIENRLTVSGRNVTQTNNAASENP